MVVKNFITGIGGFVASHLADLLIEKGEEVYGSYRWTEDLSNIEHIKDKITLIPMDLNDLSSCIKAINEVRPDYIFHLAAQSDPRASFAYPIETIRTNTLGTLNLLEAIRMVKEHDKNIEHITATYDDDAEYDLFDPVVHICSSSEVYGLVKKEDVPIKETQGFNPANPYAVGKVGCDMIALMYWTNYKIKTIRTRMFTHTSGRRKMLSAECNFARQIAGFEYGDAEGWNTPKEGYTLRHGNLDSLRTWAHARDAVEAYYLLVRKGTPGEVYNIGGTTSVTIGDMLKYMISLSPLKDKIKLEQDPSLLRPYDVTLQVPDVSKFRNACPEWNITYTFEQIIQDVLDGWRQRCKTQV